MADPEEDRINPIKPEQWPEEDAPTTVQRLATEIRAGIITKEMFARMSWAIVYGGVRLGHSAEEPNVRAAPAFSILLDPPRLGFHQWPPQFRPLLFLPHGRTERVAVHYFLNTHLEKNPPTSRFPTLQVYTVFGNSGMLPTFHDPEVIQLDDPMWTAAVARGAATSHDGQYKLSGESEEAVRVSLWPGCDF